MLLGQQREHALQTSKTLPEGYGPASDFGDGVCDEVRHLGAPRVHIPRGSSDATTFEDERKSATSTKRRRAPTRNANAHASRGSTTLVTSRSRWRRTSKAPGSIASGAFCSGQPAGLAA